jgi:hypothetical protein
VGYPQKSGRTRQQATVPCSVRKQTLHVDAAFPIPRKKGFSNLSSFKADFEGGN